MQFGLVAAREAMDQAGLPGRLEGELAERTGVDPRDRARRRRNAGRGHRDRHHRGARTASARSSSPMGIPNVGSGQVAISFGMTGPNFATVSRVRHRRPRDRRGVRDDPPRRRRRHARGRLRGRHLRAARRRVRGDARAVDPQRRPRGARRARSTTGRDGFVIGEGAGVAGARGARARAGARRGAARRARRLRRDRRRLAHHAPGAGRHRRGPGGAARPREGRRVAPTTSITSTPTRPPRPRATRRSSRRSRRSSASTRGDGPDHRQQVDDRPHARRRRRDRGDRRRS